MDQEKIGKFIKLLREENNMNQEQLAQKLHISRQTISKWELGKSLPDGLMIKELGRIFRVSTNDILNGERVKNIDDLTLNIYDSRKKAIRLVKSLVIIIILLLLAFFIYYFISSFNSIKVYTINGESEKLIIANGIFVDTNEKIYFQLGEIRNKSEYNILNIELYYTEDSKKTNVYTCINCDSTNLNFIDYKEYNEYIASDNIDFIINNLYVDIKFDNDELETLKLNIKRDFSNNKFFNKKYSKKIEEIEKSKNLNFSIDNNVVINIKNHFKKDDDGYFYDYKSKRKKITAKYLNNELFIDVSENNDIEYWSLNFDTKILSYEKYSNDKQVKQDTFNIDVYDSYLQTYEKFIEILNFIFAN